MLAVVASKTPVSTSYAMVLSAMGGILHRHPNEYQ